MGKSKYIFLSLFLLLIACNLSQKEDKAVASWDDKLTTEQNIAKNAIPLQTDKEFPFLDPIAKTRSVIILGEEEHDDLTTTKVKIEMINYLRQKGFNHLALEVTPFLTTYVFSQPVYREATKDWKFEDFGFPRWLRQPTFKRLIREINNREIKLWGIDMHLDPHDIIAARCILEKYTEKEYTPLSINWDELNDLYYRRLFFYGEHPSPEEQYKLMRMIDSISNYTYYLISKRGEITDLQAILQWIRNINTNFSYTKYIQSEDSDKIPLIFRNRDLQMAENVLWLTKHFPNEKFTLWCANFHGAKDVSQTTYPTDSLHYFIFQSMGESISNTLGDKCYSLAFTSLNNGKEAGRLESEISKATDNSPFAFIDFESLRFQDGYRDKEFESSPILKKIGKWLYIFDGIYYIRDQKLFQEAAIDQPK